MVGFQIISYEIDGINEWSTKELIKEKKGDCRGWKADLVYRDVFTHSIPWRTIPIAFYKREPHKSLRERWESFNVTKKKQLEYKVAK